MKGEFIAKFMQAIGIPKPEVQGKWLMGSCPLAPWRHKKGTDSRASFGINTETGNFNCFTCDSGSLERLLQTLEMYVQQDPKFGPKFHFDVAHELLQGLEDYTEPLPEYEEIVPAGDSFREWPDWGLNQFIPWRLAPRAEWFLAHGRQELDPKNQPVDPAVADQLKFMYDPKHDRLVTPFWTWTGKLAGARGRACTKDATLKHFDYTCQSINNSRLVWYGEDSFEASAAAKRPVIVVEGQFDVANVRRVYPYCIGGLTAKGAASRMKVLQNLEGVLLMLDADETGKDAVERYKQFLQGRVPLGTISFPPEYKDPGCLPLNVLQDILGDLL